MPNWNGVLEEISEVGGNVHAIRKKYLGLLHEKTGRNVIAYYSGAFSNSCSGPSPTLFINDDDKNGFMTTIHGLDRSLGLDIILHTPGGDIAATESLVTYLRSMFGSDIRAIVPQIAMSAGTMIACACKSILMGKQSSLGPIDPQINNVPAKGVVQEFDRALDQIKNDPQAIQLWQFIIGQYHPTFLGECRRSIDWSKSIVKDWLASGMFSDADNPEQTAESIAHRLSDNEEHYVHARHIHLAQVEEIGLKVEKLEEDEELQDLVLTIHHTFMHTCQQRIQKLIENHNGVGIVQREEPPQQVILQQPAPVPAGQQNQQGSWPN